MRKQAIRIERLRRPVWAADPVEGLETRAVMRLCHDFWVGEGGRMPECGEARAVRARMQARVDSVGGWSAATRRARLVRLISSLG